MEYEIPPMSANGKFRLVATTQHNDETYLIFIGEGAPYGCRLVDIENYSQELQDYVNGLFPKLLSGVYDEELLKT
ncbi:hypothetical protein [Virgibacillus sp. CBA3643]|uniref:hypothetical protein n=1 Tax=Virgibacillus sp. CBA3643 TaxID=2942278 RepID=UPI0035A326E7